MSQITHATTHPQALACSLCRAKVSARYERCLSCAKVFHLACIDPSQGCPTSECSAHRPPPEGRTPLPWLELYRRRTQRPLLIPSPRLELRLSDHPRSGQVSEDTEEEWALSGVQGFLLCTLFASICALLIWIEPSTAKPEALLGAIPLSLALLSSGSRAWLELLGNPFWG